jgi:cell shape-determining protein MreD
VKQAKLSPLTIIGAVLSVILALTISAVPIGVGAQALPWPNLTICVVFFWLVHCPPVLPTLVIAVIGLAHDLIGGGIPGAGMLALVVASLAVRAGADALSRSVYGAQVVAFIAFAAAVLLIEWSLTALPRWTTPALGPAFAQFFVTVLAYLPLSLLMRKLFGTRRT